MNYSRVLTQLLVLLGINLLALSASTLNYQDQSSWSGMCQIGKRQSPIDLASNLKYENNQGVFEIVEFSYPQISGVKTSFIDGKFVGFNTVGHMGHILVEINDRLKVKYNLIGVHLHSKSEHAFSGVKYAAEMHLVHSIDEPYFMAQNPGYTSEFKNIRGYLAVGILLDAGGPDNQEITDLKLGSDTLMNDFELEKLISNTMKFYHYQGSLTTPPCGEVVNWVVKAEVVKISNAQLDIITKIQADNLYNFGTDRNLQPLENRPVYYSSTSFLQYTFVLFAVFLILLF